MRRINVMLKKKIKLLALGFCLLLCSCNNTVKVWGLTPGKYYFQSVEGVLPSGWSFDASSYFDFKSAITDDPNFDATKDQLQCGQWQFPRYEITDGEKSYEFDSNYIIQWYNTPFDMLPSALDCGAANYVRSGPARVMRSTEAQDGSDAWSKYIGEYGFDCFIGLVDKKDISKRTLTVSLSFVIDGERQDDWTKITFSM